MITRAKCFIKEYIIKKNLADQNEITNTPTPNMPLKKSLQFFDFDEGKLEISNSTTSGICRELIEYQNISIDANSNVIDFWKSRRTKFPTLFSVVKRLWIAQPTSTPVERLFSASGYMVWDRRNR